MKSIAVDHRSANRQLRFLLQSGTALPLLLAAWPALADPIVQTADGDISVSAASATGTPTAVDLTSNLGSVTATVTSVSGVADASQRAPIVSLETLTNGTVAGTFGSITGTGNGQLLGLNADSYGGTVTLKVGTLDLSGAATPGIYAHSVDGAVTIAADKVITRGTGQDSQGELYEAILGASDNNSVAINVGSSETYGQNSSAVGATAGGTATVTVDTAIAHYQNAVTAYAFAAGDALIDAKTLTQTASAGQGAWLQSGGGKATLIADTINTGTFGSVAYLKAAGDIAVSIGTASSGSGVQAVTTDAGNIGIDVGSITGYATLIQATTAGGNIAVAADALTKKVELNAARYSVANLTATGAGSITGDFGTINAKGGGAVIGVRAITADGAIALNADSVDVDGSSSAGILGRSTNGAVAITAGKAISRSTGLDPQGETYEAILGDSKTGSVTIKAGSAESFGKSGSAIGATAGGTATITADSAIAHDNNVVTVYASSGGNASVDVKSIVVAASAGQGAFVRSTAGIASLASDSIKVGDFAQGGRLVGFAGATANVGTITGGSGLQLESAGGGNLSVAAGSIDSYSIGINAIGSGGDIAIDAGTVTSKNNDTSAISATTTVAGKITIDIDKASGAGIDRGTVYAVTDQGDIKVTGGTVTASGDGGLAVVAKSTGGNITVALDHLETTGLQMANGHTPDGIYAESTNGTATVTLNTGTTIGFASTPAAAIGGAGASVSVGQVSTAGDQAVAVYAASANGDAVVNAGSVVLTGNNQAGIQALAGAGKGVVTVNSVTGQGTAGMGVLAQGRGGASITSGTVVAQRDGLRAIGLSNSSASIVTSGNTTSANGSALYATGGTVNVTTAANTVTTGASAGIRESATGAASVSNAGTVTATGDLGSAIYVATPGAVTIASNVATVTGAGADPGVRSDGSGYRVEQGGIIVEGGAGPIAINATTVNVAGQYRYGISARGTGAINVNAGNVTLASADSVAVAARGGAGNVALTTGTVTTTGASGAGVLGSSSTGNVTINAGTTRVEATGKQGNFTGDAVVGTSGSGTVAITSQNAFSAAAGGSAVVGTSGGNVSVLSNVAQTTGDGGIALYALSTGGNASLDSADLTLAGNNARVARVQATNGTASARFGNFTALGTNTGGAIVTGRDVRVTVDGAVRSTNAAITASGATVNVAINGSAASTSQSGVAVISSQGQATVASGASVTGVTGMFLQNSLNTGGLNQVVNSGTITGTGGAAIVAVSTSATTPTSYYIHNNGVLVGTGGTAVVTGNGDDVLELTENSIITGIVDLGAGDDRLSLDFNDNAAAGRIGTVAATRNVEGLSVDTGSWRASGPESHYDFVDIARGATLTVAEDANEQGAISAPHFTVDGRLNLELTGDASNTGILIDGAGSVHLTGSAVLHVEDATGLQYTGGTFVENGALLLTTVYGGDITTSGSGVFQLGVGGTAGDMTGDIVNNGKFIFNRSDDYTLAGDFSGTGVFDKLGAGRLTFGGLYAFDGVTNLKGGSIAFAGALAEDTQLQLAPGGTFDLSQVAGGEQQIAELSGTGGTLALGDTALTVEQSVNTVYTGAITGTGELIKSGSGDLKLNGDGTTFTGTGQVNGGTLSVNGNFLNTDFVVNPGGTLGGNGTVGDTTIRGGTLAAGNSIGRLTINGDLTLTSSSIFAVEANAAGQADRVDVTGKAALGGAKVAVTAAPGTYKALTDYTILTAAGGITGTFGSVSSNLAFLSPYLTYTNTAVSLRLVRNDVAFGSLAQGANQVGIANLIQSYGYGNALYNQTLTLVDAAVPGTFASLTGEVYPTYGAAAIETAEMIRRQTMGKMSGTGPYLWATGLYNSIDSGDATGRVKLDGKGVAAGFGIGAAGLSASIGGGILDQDQGAGQFDGGQTKFAIAQASYDSPIGLSAAGGIQLGWIEGDTRRQTTLGTINQTAAGAIKGDYLQLFGEVGYKLGVGGVSVEPFVGLSHVSLNIDGLAEVGSAASLRVAEIDRDVTFGDIGLKLSVDLAGSVRPFASAAYRHAWGDTASIGSVGFVGFAGNALVGGVPVAKDAAELAAGLALTTGRVDIEVGYRGTISDTFDGHGVNAGVRLRF